MARRCFHCLATAVLLAAVAAQQVAPVTPIEKVITLLQDLKTQQTTEASTEATNYNAFACFCKTTTLSKSTEITTGKDNINSYSSDIELKTAQKATKQTELTQKKEKLSEKEDALAEETARCAKEAEEYQVKSADLQKALDSLTRAINSIEATRPTLFISIKTEVASTLAIANKLNLIDAPKRKALSSFVQQTAGVDPNSPEYKFHSQPILDLLLKIKQEFTDEKATLDTEWTATNTACINTKAAINTAITNLKNEISTLGTDISTLASQIATARSDLVDAEAELKDDELYMNDLTKRCEDRAHDWDQRSTMRSQEIEAISEALGILTTTVKDKALNTDAGKRALLLNMKAALKANQTIVSNRDFRTPVSVIDNEVSSMLSFLQQGERLSGHPGAALVQRAGQGLSTSARQIKAVSLLRSESKRLKSTALATLAARIAADPFKKVKKLIQDLIERLLTEATAEATKKGFCDEQLAKAESERNTRLNEAKSLNVDISALEVKQDQLELEIQLLNNSIVFLTATLQNATTLRGQEKAANLLTIADAKEGLDAVTQAIIILKSFYRKSAKATVLAQYSPVDEDTSGPGFTGAYKGNQAASKGIIGLLEVIQTDFTRAERNTRSAESRAQREFIKFDRDTKADISGKETKKTLDKEDLVTTKADLLSKSGALKTQMDLVDAAIRDIEDLKPTCIDTGMSYADRVAKRQDEMDSLKKALCILDTEDVELDCPGPPGTPTR